MRRFVPKKQQVLRDPAHLAQISCCCLLLTHFSFLLLDLGVNLFRTAQQTRQDDVATLFALRQQYATITPRRRNAAAMILGKRVLYKHGR